MDWLRKLVSRQLVRVEEPHVNLDLAYILKNKIIAMSYPSSGVQSIYRNKIEDVVNFLENHHKGCYKILNLTGVRYKRDMFHEMGAQVEVIEFSQDHHSPPLDVLFSSVSTAYKYIAVTSKPDNVIVVHCLAGKGRTGTLICCLLYMMRVTSSIEESVEYYGWKRHKKKKGLTQPSQLRYAKYFEQILKRSVQSSPMLMLYRVGIYNVTDKLEPVFVIYSNGKIVTEMKSSSYKIRYDKRNVIMEFANIPLIGDIFMTFSDHRQIKNSFMFRLCFNTGFVENFQMAFNKYDLDPYEFKKSSLFSDKSYIELNFQAYCFNDFDPSKPYSTYCKQCLKKKQFNESIEKWEKVDATITTYEAMNNMSEYHVPNLNILKDEVRSIQQQSCHQMYKIYFEDLP